MHDRHSHTVLKYAADLVVYPKATHILIALGKQTHQFPADTLLILDAFRMPRSRGDAIRHLTAHYTTRAEFLRMIETINTLIRLGALVDDAREEDQPPTLALHRLLLRDEYRTHRYLDALRAVIRPGDVVLDIGTGTGILAAGAALSGARHVYAVEAGSMAEIARQVFEANGLSDRITTIAGWSTEITLPERADVLVSEILSGGVFGQNILNVTDDAVKRLLKPGARLIPNRVRLYALLTEVSAEWLEKQQFTPRQVNHWKAVYGVDFSPLLRVQDTLSFSSVEGSTAAGWKFLSAPILLADLDLARLTHLSVNVSVTASAEHSGTLNGVILFFEADLAPEIAFTTHPCAPERPFAWATPVALFNAHNAEAGDRFDVTINHQAADRYTVGLRRHDEGGGAG